jgi:hypothetical protein
MSSCPSATGTPASSNSSIGRCSGPVCGSLTNPSPARFASPPAAAATGVPRSPPPARGRRPRGRRDRGRASPARASRWCEAPGHRRRPRASRPAAAAGGEPAGPVDVPLGVAVAVLDPGIPPTTSAPSRIASSTSSAAPGSRTPRPAGTPRSGRRARPEALAGREHAVQALQAAGGVDVDERLHVQGSVPDRLDQRPRRRSRRSRTGRSRLDLARASSIAVIAEPIDPAGVGRQRVVADPRQRVHLVEVQVAVDEALGDQPPVGVEHPFALQPTFVGDGHDPAAVDPDIHDRPSRNRPARTTSSAIRRPPAMSSQCIDPFSEPRAQVVGHRAGRHRRQRRRPRTSSSSWDVVEHGRSSRWDCAHGPGLVMLT